MLNIPLYNKITDSRFNEIIDTFNSILKECVLCPRQCKVNRLKKELGYCRSGPEAKIASFNLHHGEEPPISGIRGSGTIFFSGCTLQCIYCQNYPISHLNHGEVVGDQELAGYMLELQEQGAHNINLVTPTHFIPAIVRALMTAIKNGLSIPIVYNSSGYERLEIVSLLKDIVDIYMPDAKYASEAVSKRYSDAPDYSTYNCASLKEMYRQVGNLVMDSQGIAQKGLMVRHLVLPRNIRETEHILTFLRDEISPDIYLSLMAQYHPAYKADTCTELQTSLPRGEYKTALKIADKLGVNKGWRQHL